MTRTIDDLGPHVASRYPHQSQFANVNGWRMHYVDEGPRGAPPVLLLHGNPTWGYLWRDTIPPLLAAGYRVIVPDQIGFGMLCGVPHKIPNTSWSSMRLRSYRFSASPISVLKT